MLNIRYIIEHIDLNVKKFFYLGYKYIRSPRVNPILNPIEQTNKKSLLKLLLSKISSSAISLPEDYRAPFVIYLLGLSQAYPSYRLYGLQDLASCL